MNDIRIYLTKFLNNKMLAAKCLRDNLGYSIRDAVELIDDLPQVVVVSRDEFFHFQKEFDVYELDDIMCYYTVSLSTTAVCPKCSRILNYDCKCNCAKPVSYKCMSVIQVLEAVNMFISQGYDERDIHIDKSSPFYGPVG